MHRIRRPLSEPTCKGFIRYCSLGVRSMRRIRVSYQPGTQPFASEAVEKAHAIVETVPSAPSPVGVWKTKCCTNGDLFGSTPFCQ